MYPQSSIFSYFIQLCKARYSCKRTGCKKKMEDLLGRGWRPKKKEMLWTSLEKREFLFLFLQEWLKGDKSITLTMAHHHCIQARLTVCSSSLCQEKSQCFFPQTWTERGCCSSSSVKRHCCNFAYWLRGKSDISTLRKWCECSCSRQKHHERTNKRDGKALDSFYCLVNKGWCASDDWSSKYNLVFGI